MFVSRSVLGAAAITGSYYQHQTLTKVLISLRQAFPMRFPTLPQHLLIDNTRTSEQPHQPEFYDWEPSEWSL